MFLCSMKKLRFLFVIVLFLLVIYSLWAWFQVGSRPDKIGLHRCNSLEKLEEKGGGYDLIEVDVCIRENGQMDVTHDEDTTFGLDIVPYFAYLHQHPEKRMWMDIKNLDEENKESFFVCLDSLCRTYEIAHERLIVETPRWDFMRLLAIHDFCTSYYVDAPKPSELTRRQMDSVITRLDRVASSGCVRALSFPGWWYMALRGQYKDRDIAFLTWKHRSIQWEVFLCPEGKMMLADDRVKAILVKDKGRYHR